MDRIELLQTNVQQLIDRYVALENENAELKKLIDKQKQESMTTYIEINELKKHIARLESINAVLGNDAQKAKLKQYVASQIKKLDRALFVLKI